MDEPGALDTIELWRRLLGEVAPTQRVLDLPPQTIERAMRVAPAALVAAAIGGDPAATQAKPVTDYGRYLLSRHLEALRWIEELGVSVVAMKGFAAALTDWPDPAQRVVGDLDLLVRRQDVKAIVDGFERRGFRFGGTLKTRWGFLSDASFLPFYSPDAACNIDLHIEPDSYPLHLGLDADAVFAAARTIDRGGLTINVPSAEHALLIAVANLAKDKFPLADARKLIDMARLLNRRPLLDWPEIESRARRARLTIALRTALSLAVALGVPASSVPTAWQRPPASMRGIAWQRLLKAWRGFDGTPVATVQLLQREWLLSASPAVAARLTWRRLRGLLAPGSGVPAGDVG